MNKAAATIISLGVIVTVLFTSNLATDVSSSPSPTKQEKYLHGLVNGMRLRSGYKTVGFAFDLLPCARQHVAAMAKAGTAYHSKCPALEAVGEGPRLDYIFRAFKASKPHWKILRCACKKTVTTAVRDDGFWYIVILMQR